MFFRKKKPDPASFQKNADLLQKKVMELEKQLENVKGQHIEYHFHIAQVDIHNPVLEELSFQLDQLDIEELSGALNLGNNFGVAVGEKEKKSKSEQKTDIKINFKEKEKNNDDAFT